MIGALACRVPRYLTLVPSWHIARSCPHRQKAATSMARLAWLWRQTSINSVFSLCVLGLSLPQCLRLCLYQAVRTEPYRPVTDAQLYFVHTICIQSPYQIVC